MTASISSTPRRPQRAVLGPSTLLLSLLLLLGQALAGCNPAPSQRGQAARQAAAEREWDWLQKAKQELDAKRARLEAEEGGKPQEVAALKAEVAREAGELRRRLVAFLNAQPPVAGETLSPRQKAAIRIKSDEDILLGRSFIEQGGDFQRAIEIYESALGLDPGYDRLQSELQEARARRYVAKDTFDEVKEGMTEDEVRAILGQPNLHNVREYSEHNVVGWFYPKDETGAAAGVWLEKAGGTLKVYKLDFEAIRPHAPSPEGPPVT